VAAVAQQAQATVAVRAALQLQRDVLDQDRHTRERRVLRHRAGVVESVLRRPDEDGAQLGVDRLDRLDRGLDELDRGRLTPADQIGLGGRVEPDKIGAIHQWFPFVSPVLFLFSEETLGRNGTLKPWRR
jgi:hypothetical protein